MYIVSAPAGRRQAKRLAANDPPAVQRQVEPGRQQPLARSGRPDSDHRRQQDLLLVDLLVEPLRAAPGDDVVERRRPSQVSQLYITAVVVDATDDNARSSPPGHLSVEPAAESAEHDARLGQLPHSDRGRTESRIAARADPARTIAPTGAGRDTLSPARGPGSGSGRYHGIPDQTQGAGGEGRSPHPARAASPRDRGGA